MIEVQPQVYFGIIALVFIYLLYLNYSAAQQMNQCWLADNEGENEYFADVSAFSKWTPNHDSIMCGSAGNYTQEKICPLTLNKKDKAKCDILPRTRKVNFKPCTVKGRYITITKINRRIGGVPDDFRITLAYIHVVGGGQIYPIVSAKGSCLEDLEAPSRFINKDLGTPKIPTISTCPGRRSITDPKPWIIVDLGQDREIQHIVLSAGTAPTNSLEGIQVTVSDSKTKVVFTGPVFTKGVDAKATLKLFPKTMVMNDAG